MTVEADIYTLLQGFVGGRAFPDVAPFSTVRPYITYQQVGGEVINYTDAQLPDKQNGFFQINVWATSRAAAAALSLQVDAALRAASAFQAEPQSAPIATHDPDLDLYGTIQDFSIWSAR